MSHISLAEPSMSLQDRLERVVGEAEHDLQTHTNKMDHKIHLVRERYRIRKELEHSSNSNEVVCHVRQRALCARSASRESIHRFVLRLSFAQSPSNAKRCMRP